MLGRDLDPGLPTGDYDASNLGMDRLVDCVAALARWRPPLAVFDMGTATTLSVVDREGVFRGGMILPGLRLSVDALSARAAQLPCITFTQPEGLLGTDTVSCMRSGALYGAAAALEGISLRLEEELGPVTVVLTGGHGRDILPLLRRAVEYEPHLQLMGLRELWLRSLWKKGGVPDRYAAFFQPGRSPVTRRFLWRYHTQLKTFPRIRMFPHR